MNSASTQIQIRDDANILQVAIAPLAVDLKSASAMSGYSVKTLRRAIEAGELLPVRATTKIVIMVCDLMRYLESHRDGVAVATKAPSKPVNKKVAMPNLVSGGQGRSAKRS